MTQYELINLQRGIGNVEGIIRLQKANPTAFTPLENWVISHLATRKMIEEREQKQEQEKELQKEINRVTDEIIKEINKKL